MLFSSLQAAAQSDAVERGEQLYAWCYACHSVTPDEDELQGPNLFGIIGSPAASRPDYPYSDALVSLRENGLAWTQETMDRFIEDPQAFAPNNTMSFFGMPDDEDRADLIAYLIEISVEN